MRGQPLQPELRCSPDPLQQLVALEQQPRVGGRRPPGHARTRSSAAAGSCSTVVGGHRDVAPDHRVIGSRARPSAATGRVPRWADRGRSSQWPSSAAAVGSAGSAPERRLQGRRRRRAGRRSSSSGRRRGPGRGRRPRRRGRRGDPARRPRGSRRARAQAVWPSGRCGVAPAGPGRASSTAVARFPARAFSCADVEQGLRLGLAALGRRAVPASCRAQSVQRVEGQGRVQPPPRPRRRGRAGGAARPRGRAAAGARGGPQTGLDPCRASSSRPCAGVDQGQLVVRRARRTRRSQLALAKVSYASSSRPSRIRVRPSR